MVIDGKTSSDTVTAGLKRDITLLLLIELHGLQYLL